MGQAWWRLPLIPHSEAEAGRSLCITGQSVLHSELRNQPKLQSAPDSKQNQKRTNEYKSYQKFHNDNVPSM